MRSLRRFLAAMVIVLTLTLALAAQASAAPRPVVPCSPADPCQLPIGTPVALIVIVPALIFLPSI